MDRRKEPDSKHRTTGQRSAQAAAEEGRDIQAKADRRDRSKPPEKPAQPMQAGQREYPEKFPAQHLKKPGLEADLDLAPMYKAPDYIGSDKLKDCVALITGGDSGIGRAIAVLYAREGADVAIAYLDEHEDAEKTKRDVEREGRRCIVIAGDVVDPKFCEGAVKQTLDELGRLDILVNNAAFQQHVTDITDISDEQFERTLKELLDYSMTKGGIHAFTRSLAANLIGRGIRVNAVAPGPVWTPLNPADRPAEDVKKFGSKTPMQRAAQSEEIAPAFVFMAAPSCSSYITGEVLPIIGGY